MKLDSNPDSRQDRTRRYAMDSATPNMLISGLSNILKYVCVELLISGSEVRALHGSFRIMRGFNRVVNLQVHDLWIVYVSSSKKTSIASAKTAPDFDVKTTTFLTTMRRSCL